MRFLDIVCSGNALKPGIVPNKYKGRALDEEANLMLSRSYRLDAVLAEAQRRYNALKKESGRSKYGTCK
jgi:hypothetical protein